ncbi:MAG: AbrB/MazE/SpoVT family DNA-binding domain-containing protein [Oscillospiraceae bacterium]|nr:AbrB/MazE/SpoVT family DNA-binding domain-containing protein [Oscillospiraceae bacterium]
MKTTGIVRKIDDLGRIVIPIELRKTLGLSVRDDIEIIAEEDRIVLKRYSPACMICGSAENVKSYMDKKVCANCIEELGKL